MKKTNLDEIEARWKATTPGEWELLPDVFATRISVNGDIIGHFASPNGTSHATFVAEAHNHDIPELIEEVRELREELNVVDGYVGWAG